MGNHADKDLKVVKNRERVFQMLSEKPRDLTSLRSYSVKRKVVASGNKFDKAIEMLKSQGRILVKAGKVSIVPSGLKSATFIAKGRGGYLLIDGDTRQWQIDARLSEGYNSNDRVNVAFNDYEGKKFPFIVSRIADPENEYSYLIQKPKTVLGRCVKTSHDNLVFIPNDRKYSQNIMILNQKSTLSRYQDKICVLTIVDDETSGHRASGVIAEIKGDAGNPIHEYDAIAESHGANMSWAGEALQREIDAIPAEVDEGVLNNPNVADLRHLAFTTVDPATCKDMDDAIYSTFDEYGRLVVYTAVANVTKYVGLNSEIGKRYVKAGFTTYAPNKAYNILPPELSTGICSLNPNVPRRAFVVKTVIDEKSGKPLSSQFLDAVIESREKFSYERAQELVDESGENYPSLRRKILTGGTLSTEEQVVFNSKVADILWKGFNTRQMLRFETKDEYDIHFDETFSDIVDITAQPHIPYHKVIEAFMLTANEASAKFALENDIPNIYRVHDAPNEDKLEQAYEFFSYLGVPFDGDLSPHGLRMIIASVAGSYKEKSVNNFLIRMQSKAKYSSSTSPHDVEVVGRRHHRGRGQTKQQKLMQEGLSDMENISHFGLQSKHYSHTTSPIRRITDYVTHYNILAYLNGGKMLDENRVLELAQWANQMQDQNDLAEREFAEVNSAIYCEGHIGEVFHGRVSGFKRTADSHTATIDDFIVFVENEDKGIKVQIPASEIVVGGGTKNIAISPYGSAIISKSGEKPLVRLCDSLSFRITEASRLTREVKATANLEMTQERVAEVEEKFVKGSTNLALSAKRQKMLQNVEYHKARQEEEDAQEAMFASRGKKHQEMVSARTGFPVDSVEAYHTNKNDGINHKKKKYTNQAQEIAELDNGDIENE